MLVVTGRSSGKITTAPTYASFRILDHKGKQTSDYERTH